MISTTRMIANSGIRGETDIAARDRFLRHRGPVTGVALIPNSNWAVTSGYDGAVGLFDIEANSTELLGYHEHLVNSIFVDGAGRTAASCSSDYSIGLWDLDTRRPVRSLIGHADDVEAFVFIDATTGASASRDRRILIWDLETGAIKRALDGHDNDALSIAYHDGRIYSSGDDMTLRVWDLSTGELLSKWGPFENETDTCAIDGTHARAVLGCDDGHFRVFDVRSGDLTHDVKAHSSGIKRVAVSPATGDILTAAYDQRLIVWDARTMQSKVVLEATPAVWERSLTWTPDGDRILGGTFDGTVLVWDAASGKLTKEVGDRSVEAGNPCFNEVSATDTGRCVTVSDDGLVRLLSISPAAAVLHQQLAPESGRRLMNAITIDEEYRLVVAGAHNHTLHIFRNEGDRLSDRIEVPLGEGPINSIRISHQPGHEGEAYAACYSGAIVRVAPSGEIRGRIRVHEGAVKSLRLHPTAMLGASCGADGLLQSWSLTGEPLQRYRGHVAIINDLDLSPSGDHLASVSRDFSVKVFEVLTGKLVQSIPIGRKSLKSVCFWSESVVLIGDYWGGLIKVTLADGTFVRRVIARNGISALARSGSFVVASSYDGAIRLIRPEDLHVVQTHRAMHQRLDELSAA